MSNAGSSRWSIGSHHSVLSLWSDHSALSIGSVGSFASIGSVGSFASGFSIGSSQSFGSWLCHQCTGSVLSRQSDGYVASSQAARARKLPRGSVVVLAALSGAAVAGHQWFWVGGARPAELSLRWRPSGSPSSPSPRG